MSKNKIKALFKLIVLSAFCYGCSSTVATSTSTIPSTMSAWSTPSTTSQPSSVVSQITPTLAKQSIATSDLWPSHIHWQKMVSTSADLNDLRHVAGEPDQIQTYAEGKVYQYWPGPDRATFTQAVLVEETIQLISIVPWYDTSFGSLPNVLLGRQAKALMLNRVYLNQEEIVYAFPSEGFAVGVEGEKITSIQYFAPTDTETYLAWWGRQHSRGAPFPSRLDKVLDLLVKRDVVVGRTKAEIEESLGRRSPQSSRSESCQWTEYRVASDDRSLSFWIYISYSGQSVSSIHPRGDDAIMTFADIIRELGKPDLVLGDPDDPRNQANLLSLVYLQRGIQFNVGGLRPGIPDIELPDEPSEFGGEGTVYDIVLFSPRSQEDYLADVCLNEAFLFYKGEKTILWEEVDPFKLQPTQSTRPSTP